VLKITVIDTPSERRWVLQGQLAGPWVHELRASWKKHQRSQKGQRCVMDLDDVTLIDNSGEKLLGVICKKGVQLLANGVYTKHVLEKVKAPHGKNFNSALNEPASKEQ
jgi:ABC-type transporter Mla MlaB component